MKSGGYFILGGLLQGVGKGIMQQDEERRQAALAALKRSNDLEDRKLAGQQAIDLAKTNHAARLDEIAATGDENRSTEEVRAAADITKIKLTKSMDLSNSTTIEKVKHDYNLSEITAKSLADTAHDLKIANITPDHYEIGANGQIVIWKKDGTAFVRGNKGDFVPRGSKDDDEGASITGETTSRGTAPKPAAPAAASEPPAAAKPAGGKGQALVQLSKVYAEAASDPAKREAYRRSYPAMFNPDGSLKPRSEVVAMVNQAYQ